MSEKQEQAGKPAKATAEKEQANTPAKTAAAKAQASDTTKKASAKEQPGSAAKAAAAPKKEGTRRVTFRAIPTAVTLAVIVALGASAVSLYLWQQQRVAEQDRQALSASIERLLQVVEQKSQQQRDDVERLSQYHQLLKQEMSVLEQRIPDLRQQLLSRQRDWDLAEADYLLRLAGHRLQFSHDVAGASAALTLASDLLYRRNAERFTQLILQIRANVDKLTQFSRNDILFAMSQLNGLIASLDTLPLASLQARDAGEAGETGGPDGGLSETLAYWGRKIWSDLKSLVVIRRGDEIRQPLTTENQRFFIQSQLQFKLEAARLAVSRHDQVLFVANIEETDKLLARYYGRDSKEVDAARASLKELATRSVALPIASLDPLREQLFQQLGNPSPTEAVSPGTPAGEAQQEGTAPAATERQP